MPHEPGTVMIEAAMESSPCLRWRQLGRADHVIPGLLALQAHPCPQFLQINNEWASPRTLLKTGPV